MRPVGLIRQRAVDLRAVVFFAGLFRAVVFRAVDFLAVDFLAGLFRAVDFRAVDFFAAVFLAVDFLAVDFLAGAFFAAVLRAVVFFAAVFLAGDFRAVVFLATAMRTSFCDGAPGRARHSLQRVASMTHGHRYDAQASIKLQMQSLDFGLQANWLRSRSATLAASPGAYFVRGQKNPRKPSPFVRGTTCTWR
jgi:hypothetical protein